MIVTGNILIVDDQEKNLIALEALLEDCPANIYRATNGNDALTLILKHDFALVLLDVQMPGMDGFETAKLMRLNAKTKQIPIIFVTAISKDQQYVFQGYQSGAVDYLPKPIDPIILQSKVNIFLEMWRNREELATALAEVQALSKQLEYQAQYDALTGLPNRLLFRDRLKQAVLMSIRNGSNGALMFIDLDKFKPINDSLGHDAGDQLLIQVAQRLTQGLRATDTVARLGGDEFTVILQNLEDESAAHKIARTLLDRLEQPFELGSHQVSISASIGIAFFPKDSQEDSELIINADTAMYQAKHAGRSTYRCFESDAMSNQPINAFPGRRADER